MKIKPFELERYFARYEFSAPFLLSCSDCEPLALGELLEMADDDSLKLWKELKLGYTESRGHPLLRAEIAKLYQERPADDLLTVVPEEGIFIAVNCLLQKGDHLVVTFPAYQSLYEIANSLGCDVSFWRPNEDQSWRFEVGQLLRLLRENTRLVVINFPHNPTGATISGEQLRELINVLRERRITLFSDEMYRFLEYEPRNRLPSAVDIYEHAVTLGGLSKSFSLAGLRSGWLVSSEPALLEKFSAFKDYTTICSGAPDEILAIIALRSKELILKRNLEIIKANLKILDGFFNRHRDLFEWLRPQAGPVAFPALRSGISAAEFCRELLDQKGVMLLPGAVYGSDESHFRIGFGRRTMPAALELLDQYLKKY